MKKSRLSLAAITALGITTASLSANNLIDIGVTYYDLQSYGSMQNRIHVFDDGTIGAVWSTTPRIVVQTSLFGRKL